MEEFVKMRMNEVYVKKGFNVRQDAEPSKELVETVALEGVANPIHVGRLSPKDKRRFVIDGERRYRAARAAKLDRIPVRDHGVIELQKALVLHLMLNANRKELTDREEWQGYIRLREAGMGLQDAASHIGRSLKKVQELEAIYTKASKSVKDAIGKPLKEGGISSRVGARIASIPDKKKQNEALEEAKGKGRREGEKIVGKKKKGLNLKRPGPKTRKAKKPDPPTPEPVSAPNGVIVFRDDYPVAENIRDRMQLLEHEARIQNEFYPSNPTFIAYLSVLEVLKGKKSVSSLFTGF